ncbi:adenylate/guanylate cyclase domain-containing protein [Thalassobaculum sp. OXR-137]|uniref:adenylate/guanylate cyclase domain-containing protein n=1 Tax=Thalassobaculum sp. OXR-137 TaxID=3100173 RepID=UPI002AC98F50|nr:adenylate/guanylate cyclase domain-containing protein [Thalassobaculum sp. OXR-137]WPZ33312.1 adenylate/guanylate cyclase domain-containing protein [Thalassobaculum sp. OXR-137]
MFSRKKPLLRPRSVPIAWLLLGGVGALVTLSLAIVLATGFIAAGQNTVELIRDRVVEVMRVVTTRTETHLRTAADHARTVARMIETEQFDFRSGDIDRVRLTMAAIPQIRGTAIVLKDGRTIRIGREDLVARGTWTDIGVTRENFDAVTSGDSVTWTDPIWAKDIGRALVVARYPIRRDGEVLGFVASGITTDDLSTFLERLSTPAVRAFLLDSENRVIAHHRTNFNLPSDHSDVAPTAEEIGDEVLAAYVRGDTEKTTLLRGLPDLNSAVVRGDDIDYAVITAPFRAVAPLQWTVGVVASTESSEILFTRLYGILIAGGTVLALTLFLLWRVAQSVRQPVTALALASDAIRRLDLDDIPDAPATTVSELRDASAAFYSMVRALRWFELYVPRRLVKRLMDAPQTDGYPTRSREVTVMFTDITGFTELSDGKDAREISELLNAHFSLIARCVEAEDGTIDKYIGDSVMAFWGAPSRQEDHAARAIRAAGAIARAIHAENEVRTAGDEPPVRIRIGLHSGTVVVGNIGAPGRVNYTLVGEPVNVANRIEQLGKEVDPTAEIVALASDVTVTDAGGPPADAQSLGERALRGVSHPIRVWRLR